MKISKKISIQKIIFYTFLIASAAIIVCSLCFISSSWTLLKAQKGVEYESFWKTLTDAIHVGYKQPSLKKNMIEAFGKASDLYANGLLFPTKLTNAAQVTFESNAEGIAYYRNVWFSIQNVNNLIFYTGLIMLLLTAICGITGCFSRKKYYISNLVSGVLTGVVGIALSVTTIIMSASLMSKLNYIKPDLDLYYQVCAVTGKAINVSEFSSSNCLIGIIMPIIFILICVGLITFTVLKYRNSNKAIKEEAVIND